MRFPLVMPVIPVRNRKEKTLRFLESLAVQTWPRLLAVVVDSNSSDGTLEAIRREFPWVRTTSAAESDYWTGATNRGVKLALDAGADYVLTINDDSILRDDFIEDLVGLAQKFDYPILGCRIDFLARPGAVWSIGAHHSWATSALFGLNYTRCREEDLPEIVCDALTVPVESTPGNGVLIHRRVFETVGVYDERNTPHYHADTEFLLRCRMNGFTPRVAPKIVVYNDADPPEPPRSVNMALPRLTLTKVINGTFFICWALIRKKSHYFFRAHAYVVRHYCPRGFRWRSLYRYLISVGCVAFDTEAQYLSTAWLEKARTKQREQQLKRAIRIVARARAGSPARRWSA